MTRLHIDIETYSSVSLKDCGVYQYAASPDFEILLFAFCFEGGEVDCVDLASGDTLPDRVLSALVDPEVLKYAHNASFEFVCISQYVQGLRVEQWRCTMIGSAYLGLPMALDKVAVVLNLPQQKDKQGVSLIKYFCVPCKPTKVNGGRLRNYPYHAPTKWEAFTRYCMQDVRTEMAIQEYLDCFPPMPDNEWSLWHLDQRINAYGVHIDRDFVNAAIEALDESMEGTLSELKEKTGVANPKSLSQLREWIGRNHYLMPSVDKLSIEDALSDPNCPPAVRDVLELRKLSSRSSASKFPKMLQYAGPDDRMRGLFQFYGAGTGRFSGKAVQLQNLKRTPKGDIEIMRESVVKGVCQYVYEDETDIISRLVRTAITAEEGKQLVVLDYSAIEARVVAWLAGEEWVLDVFRTHGKLYEATAAVMFNVAIDDVDKHLRGKGKIASLALGYEGGPGALVQMGALREGLTEDELPGIVRQWRTANPNIVKFWRLLDGAVKHVVKTKRTYELRLKYAKLTISMLRGVLFIELPSGRRLAYQKMELSSGRLTYWGMSQVRKTWVKQDTYGGSLTENVTQAIARDCLTYSLAECYKRDLHTVLHVHDEIAVETAFPIEAYERMQAIMSTTPVWALGLPLKAEGYISSIYKKD